MTEAADFPVDRGKSFIAQRCDRRRQSQHIIFQLRAVECTVSNSLKPFIQVDSVDFRIIECILIDKNYVRRESDRKIIDSRLKKAFFFDELSICKCILAYSFTPLRNLIYTVAVTPILLVCNSFQICIRFCRKSQQCLAVFGEEDASYCLIIRIVLRDCKTADRHGGVTPSKSSRTEFFQMIRQNKLFEMNAGVTERSVIDADNCIRYIHIFQVIFGIHTQIRSLDSVILESPVAGCKSVFVFIYRFLPVSDFSDRHAFYRIRD